MTLDEYLKLSGPKRRKGSGLILIKVLAFGDTEALNKLKGEFLVHMVSVRKRFQQETNAEKKLALELEMAALDYSNEVIEVAPAVRENFERMPGFDRAEIDSMFVAAQRELQRIIAEE